MDVNVSDTKKTFKKEHLLSIVAGLVIVGVFYVFLTQYPEDNRFETISEQQNNLNPVEDDANTAEALKEKLTQQRKDFSSSEKKEEKRKQLESSVTESHNTIDLEESEQKRLIIDSFL